MKYFLLAAVCACLVQVRGDAGLEEAINKGLERVENIEKNGQRQVIAALNEASYKRSLIESKASEFIHMGENAQASFEQAVHDVAETIKQKATENNRPKSVFECVDRYEENGRKTVDGIFRKFECDVKRAERVKLENMETYSKPLPEMEGAIKVKHETAARVISNCKSSQCVEIAISSFLKWLDLLYADMKRIKNQLGTAITNFERDMTTNLNNVSRQVGMIKTVSTKNIRGCLFSRATIFADN